MPFGSVTHGNRRASDRAAVELTENPLSDRRLFPVERRGQQTGLPQPHQVGVELGIAHPRQPRREGLGAHDRVAVSARISSQMMLALA